MPCRLRTCFLLALSLVFTGAAEADQVVLQIEGASADGLAVASLDLTAASRWCGITAVAPAGITAVDGDGRTVPMQFVPDADFDANERISGTAVLRLPPGAGGSVRLVFGAEARKETEGATVVSTPFYQVAHTPGKQGGLPSKITFPKTGKVFESLRWYDRAYHRQQGAFRLADDPDPKIETISAGPLCTVVRVSGRFMLGASQPDSRPVAVYQWFYFHDSPLVYVTVSQRQQQPFAWNEWHFLELNYPDEAFTRFAGARPEATGELSASKKSTSFSDWGALADGENAIGMFRAERILVYDGRGGHGTYLHAFGNAAWSSFSGTRRDLSAWLWIGSDKDPLAAIRSAAEAAPTDARVTVAVGRVNRRLAELRDQLATLGGQPRRQAWWRLAAAEQLQARGRFQDALDAADGRLPANWASLVSGDLGVALERTGDGMRLLQLADLGRQRQLLASKPLPLFRAVLRQVENREEVELSAESGWKQTESRTIVGGGLHLQWREPADERLSGLTIVAEAVPDDQKHRVNWSFKLEGLPAAWGAWTVAFPQATLAEPGPDAEVFFPRGAGEVAQGAWSRAFEFSGTYPSGWTTMPCLAVYDAAKSTGLYVAIHDPWGSTKDVRAASRPADRAVDLCFTHPASGMGRPSAGFQLEGGVWQLLRGDWFDAAVIYRDWVRQHARWYPKLGAEGRGDTPRWMRELSCWVMTGGGPDEVVPAVREFRSAMGLPVGLHWYSWHQIPFDNDYPHYFPTKEGFARGVAELKSSNVYVMPYINGRLWDTRDRGMEDYQFSSIAKAAATKDDRGEPYTEMYGSKEKDDSRVALAVMCPATELWKSKVGEIVLRLMNECGVDGVYIDQVAAARPLLCFDASHGHPLGGGHWWTESYWEMLGRIRRQMPEGRMLTTECNAEAYTQCFDGYLTWHWQYDGQVPAFPAVYGGAVQMFGRAYRGGPTKDLALRMKAAQQLVYGEQIGWCSPAVAREADNMAFLRQVVHLRARLVDYFVTGEMARPPALPDVPAVTADWQWSGVWPVTTRAVLTGAWRLPRENRAVLLFVNASDAPVTARLDFAAEAVGLPNAELSIRRITADAAEPAFASPPAFSKELEFPPKSAWAWEMTAK